MKNTIRILGFGGRDAAVTNLWSLLRKLQVLKLAGMLILITIIGFSMVACNPDDDEDADPPIVGSWSNNSEVWTFNNNGTATYALVGTDTIINFTWSISGTTLTTINIANEHTSTRSFSISGDKLTMTQITPTPGVAYTFTKQ